MIRSMIRKEWRQARRNGLLVMSCALLLLLGGASCLLGWMDYREELATSRDGNSEAREHWLEQDAKNPHTAAHYGVYVFREPGASSLFDPGVRPYAGTSVFVEAHNRNDAAWQPIQARTSLARFGNLNPAFFLIWLVPLVIIVLHFGSIAGERESRSLEAVAATGISPRRWLLGKWLSAWILPIACLTGCMAVSLLLSGGKDADPLLWLMKGAGYLLYFGCIVNITLLVSSKARTASAALLILLGLWIAGSLVAPRMAANSADNMIPTPMKHEFQKSIGDEKEAGLQERMNLLKQETLDRYAVEETKDLPINYNALSMQTNEEYTDKISDRFYAELYEHQRRQNNLYRGFSIFWPLIPARFLSMELARTDMASHHHFNLQTEQYRRKFVKLLNDDMMINSRTGEWGYQASARTWSQIPEFDHEPRTAAVVARKALPNLTILLVWFGISGLVLFAGGKNLFRRGV